MNHPVGEYQVDSETRQSHIEEDLKLQERIHEAIWSPNTWLHQKQLVDDFVLYTVMSEIC